MKNIKELGVKSDIPLLKSIFNEGDKVAISFSKDIIIGYVFTALEEG